MISYSIVVFCALLATCKLTSVASAESCLAAAVAGDFHIKRAGLDNARLDLKTDRTGYQWLAFAAFAAIRAVDPDRFVMSDGLTWGNEPVKELRPFDSASGESIHCYEPHGLTHSRNVLLPVETVVERVNRLLKGWGAFYSVGYPSRVFRKVNHYVLKRMARFLNRKSQRYYRLKFADTYYGEMMHYGLYRLAWADVRRAR